jgi:hypothetical protein
MPNKSRVDVNRPVFTLAVNDPLRAKIVIRAREKQVSISSYLRGLAAEEIERAEALRFRANENT